MSTAERWLKECRKAVEAGYVHAVIEALDVCEAEGIAPPAWLVTAAAKLLVDPPATGRRGRHASAIDRYRQDVIDEVRHDEVLACRQMGIRWIDVFYAASLALQGTDAGGSPDAIEKAYKRASRRLKSEPGRYLLCTRLVREMRIVEPRRLTKARAAIWEEIFNLAAKGKPPPLIQAQLKRKK